MTTATPEAPAKENEAGASNRPLIQGYTRPGEPKREITLWTNQRATEANPKAPDLRGHLTLTDVHGRENRILVSAWFKEEVGKMPRLTLQTDLKSGFVSKLLGSIRAMTTYNGNPADGQYGLRLIGDLKVPHADGTFELTVTGEMNRSFLDRGFLLDSARPLGFPEPMLQQFAQMLAVRDAEAARAAASAATGQRAGSQP